MPDTQYRTRLHRVVREADLFANPERRTVLFVMLNPSTADGDPKGRNDPTIRRCIEFTRGWGYARFSGGNLYAARSTDPDALLSMAGDLVGPGNDEALLAMARGADFVLAAWGSHRAARLPGPDGRPRNEAVLDLLTRRAEKDVHALGLSKDGHPWHPLYSPAITVPILYRSRRTP